VAHITDFEELSHLKELNLRELVLSNNPACAGLDEVNYKLYALFPIYYYFLINRFPEKWLGGCRTWDSWTQEK